ncbi:hypothetical protein [Chryseobacterium sp. NKUCC03_KSP]|uniref:hypothetical protein n=1 Tax=Chryseobacterium sp. NKUCC03_KSP TaxID=2842125 RepID=UPI001C5A7124|nr:hypothetical protein [Chryseobacterium sp. NKUCC03_KSP]MBW3522847.1 hypothetical protein [Chryseobacterium sp. NKUCC03_KSP]
MKAIISLALLLGLLTISCKKEVQTTPPITADTSAIDSMNTNSTRPDTTGITSRNPNDSVATIKMKDSAGVSSR